ncbi:MAG: universal stress protein [Chitinophagaceae bacterium]
MKKILAPTDFSRMSRAGLKFGIQLASQGLYEITFYHSYSLLLPTQWNEAETAQFEKIEAKRILENLIKFVAAVYRSIGVERGKTNCVVEKGVMPERDIMEYASYNNFDLICMSTHGAGSRLERLWGTNTGNLVNYSGVPVIAVPSGYKPLPITNILYASDLQHVEMEFPKVVDFSATMQADIELFHLKAGGEKTYSGDTLSKTLKKLSTLKIDVDIKDLEPDESVSAAIQKRIKKKKPSLLVMFTNRNKNWFQRIFQSSHAEQYSFHPKIPLLVYRKPDIVQRESPLHSVPL